MTLESPGTEVGGTVALAATAEDDVGVVEVRFYAGDALIGSDDTEPYSVDWDTTAVANGPVELHVEAEDAAGNMGTSAVVSVEVANEEPVTLSQIQASVFSPRCAGCHNGVGATLPGPLNLSSAAASHADLVGVASAEVPGLLRVAPGDPDNSYLIHKLEGTQSVGARMPLGGPYLSPAEIGEVRQWIEGGALND